MAPTCDSCSKRDDAAAPAAVVPDPCDAQPFHGMFDSHEDEPYESSSSGSIARHYQGVSRHVIPEASETFLRVMRQLDSAQGGDADADPATSSSSSNGTRPKELKSTASATCDKSAARECKSVKVVKKSASFSAQHASTSLQSCSNATDTTTSSSTTTTNTTKDAGSRRLSVPCTRSERHVQWADQVGAGAQLVSVRLIRPRLEVQDEDKASSPARSILRRLGVVAKDDKPVSEERSLFRRLGVGRR